MSRKKIVSPEKEIVYVMQGGGALGAYHLGIVRGLQEGGYLPDWIVGTSIGAINAAILAGNPPADRLQKLTTFWETILWKMPVLSGIFNNNLLRRFQNSLSAQLTSSLGLSGFFEPRYPHPLLQYAETPDKISFYDTTPLRNTLSSLIDFDYLNSGKMRLTVGAVDIQSGQFFYFDNHQEKLTLDHILASGALPPAFPAVKINDRFFWDGGLHSNTPIEYVLKQKYELDTLCFTVQLFSTDDSLPVTLDNIEKRKKEISFGSRYKEHVEAYTKMQNLRCAVSILGEKLPASVRKSPEIEKLLALGNRHTMDVVHFRSHNTDTQLSSKDYEFSAISAGEQTQWGHEDALLAVQKAPWKTPMPEGIAIRLHEIDSD